MIHNIILITTTATTTTTTTTTGKASGIITPNTPEMLAYYIMFQMDNGYEALLILQRLPAEIINTSELQFVCELLQARRGNNYKWFFSLLKRATFLQACIMHRYIRRINNLLKSSQIDLIILCSS